MRSVLAIGAYDPEYPRVKYLLGGLRRLGLRVFEWNIKCQLALQIIRFIRWLKRIMHEAAKSDFILVPYPGWRMIYFGKILSLLTKKPLVFDAHISRYNTFVEDRHTISPYSLKAIQEWIKDTITCSIADIVIIDTSKHGKYFERRFGIDSSKIVRVFVGVDPSVHAGINKTLKEFNEPLLYFYGTFIPLQGIPYILEALDILRTKGYDFKFILIGSGQEEEKCKKIIETLSLGDHIILYPYSPYIELLEMMKQADICLGIFGESNKAQNVIPNKVYDYAAMNKVFITGDSVAMGELFKEGDDFIGCNFADSEDLAQKLISTIENLDKLKGSLNPIDKILKFATPIKIAGQLINDLIRTNIISK